MIACDVHRPAAVDQLHVVGESVGADVYSEPGVKDAVGIAERGMAKAKAEGYGAVIVDTAGRLAIDEVLMDEIAAVRDAVQPDEILFVVDAMTGQDAVQTAKVFNDRLNFSGCHLDQTRRRRSRGCCAQHLLRGRKADQICRNGREDGRVGRLPPRADGGPHSRQG